MAQNTDDVIVLLDIDAMTLEYVSPSMERLTGFAPEDLVGRDLATLLPVPVREIARSSAEAHQVAFEGGDPEAGHYLVETEFLRKHGGRVPVELSVKILTDADGRPREHLSLCRDITIRKTAQKALRESQKRLEDLMFVVGDWIWEADAQYRYTQCSDGVRAVLGYEPSEVIGRVPWEFMPAGEAEAMRRHARDRAVRKEGCTEMVNRNLHRDGREVVLLTIVRAHLGRRR